MSGGNRKVRKILYGGANMINEKQHFVVKKAVSNDWKNDCPQNDLRYSKVSFKSLKGNCLERFSDSYQNPA